MPRKYDPDTGRWGFVWCWSIATIIRANGGLDGGVQEGGDDGRDDTHVGPSAAG